MNIIRYPLYMPEEMKQMPGSVEQSQQGASEPAITMPDVAQEKVAEQKPVEPVMTPTQADEADQDAIDEIAKQTKIHDAHKEHAQKYPEDCAECDQIEATLETDLRPFVEKMSESERNAFIKQGEEAVVEIDTLLHKSKIKIRKIVSVIIKWLKLIPGVNKFFWEQEAKKKAKEILHHHEQSHGESENEI